ncbi:MAG TPA: hypothetical protein VGX48_17795 [Pyrinomonadaceae bacterium]|jgi:hypothetical protein|nr:hypothetical protein [Pyrinomonadaceae bacterium]
MTDSSKRPTFAEWLKQLEAAGIDIPRLAPHQLTLAHFLEEFAGSEPPRRLIIERPPSRLPIKERHMTTVEREIRERGWGAVLREVAELARRSYEAREASGAEGSEMLVWRALIERAEGAQRAGETIDAGREKGRAPK